MLAASSKSVILLTLTGIKAEARSTTQPEGLGIRMIAQRVKLLLLQASCDLGRPAPKSRQFRFAQAVLRPGLPQTVLVFKAYSAGLINDQLRLGGIVGPSNKFHTFALLQKWQAHSDVGPTAAAYDPPLIDGRISITLHMVPARLCMQLLPADAQRLRRARRLSAK